MVFLSANSILLALAAPLANQGVAVNQFDIATRALPVLGNGVPLRIMPLGASITYGQASSTGNGYRLDLRAQLTAANSVNMVGSRQSGTMRDNDVEGWPGARIDQVHARAASPLNTNNPVALWRPNVVLINAGTNDAVQSYAVDGAGTRMEDLIRDVWALSPRAVVLLSTLVLNKRPGTERNVVVINRQFRDLVKKLGGEGRRIVLADMHGDAGPGAADLSDDTHPNDVGYRKMADVWARGFVEASNKGWLLQPENVVGVPDVGA